MDFNTDPALWASARETHPKMILVVNQHGCVFIDGESNCSACFSSQEKAHAALKLAGWHQFSFGAGTCWEASVK